MNSVTTTMNVQIETTCHKALQLVQMNISKQEADSNEKSLNGSCLSDIKSKVPVKIQFERISYAVPNGKESKKILNEVCGRFPANKLIAIMGPSGAGKSTLLDLISGYRTAGYQGNVFVNGKLRVLEDFRRMSCYIQQDDRTQILLTVQENMSLAADLKLGPNIPKSRKNKMVNEILSLLGLSESKNTRGGRLSGGQKKRLSIALELISNPSVMFLDEPTTGLDSSSCSQCIELLQKLAHEGRTIICTIHQPSASLFQMFDLVYILAQGNCLYQGTTSNMLNFLTNHQLLCPVYHSPADFIIEIASGEHGKDRIDILSKGINNGRSLQWFRDSNVQLDENFVEENDGNKVLGQRIKINKQMTPAYYQLLILLKRGYIKLKRDKTLTHMRIIVNFLVSIMLGLIYVNSGEDANKVFDNYNLIFSLIMHHVMSSMMLNIISFPMEVNVLLKEHFNRWYSLKMYYFANILLDIPVSTFCCIMFSTIVYYMTNQLFEWHRFGLYLFTSILLVYISQSFGYIFGTIFDVVNGTFAGPIFLVPMMMFSGFGVNLRDIPRYLVWGTHVSFFRYALEGFVEAIYGFNRRVFSCYEIYCHYRYPNKFLEEVAMTNINVPFAMGMLILTTFLVRIIGYYILLWKVRFGR